jgi:hypothetical protein
MLSSVTRPQVASLDNFIGPSLNSTKDEAFLIRRAVGLKMKAILCCLFGGAADPKDEAMSLTDHLSSLEPDRAVGIKPPNSSTIQGG